MIMINDPHLMDQAAGRLVRTQPSRTPCEPVHDLLGEDDIHLFVVQGPAGTSTADELCETLSAALPRSMHPAQVHLLSELPRMVTGKGAEGALPSRAAAVVPGGSLGLPL